MRVIIRNSSGVPIYEQIKEQIKEEILSGELHADYMLPSIRQLATDLKVSVVTTTRAYSELEQEGYIYNVQGKGCFVSSVDSELVREQMLRKIESGFSIAIKAAKIAKISHEELHELLEFTMEGNQYE
ncbi:GntR family transcriptional regulator [Ruminiclostridium cellobioparum]|uniref:Putative transcriptional regulator n=1 Tax=Ruminiclostridium cellobioparum subsp. termitidis CT1112 TaxID=1195236 RepID=S0FJM7_RUMCE|nr:GntR family transcriptional regulator [Ruminiclostridium cellobioparum]EMS71982.1 putative transcriptional regulator [Ruminiclostridium cellobioparum subsp. termitidis CT1112]